MISRSVVSSMEFNLLQCMNEHSSRSRGFAKRPGSEIPPQTAAYDIDLDTPAAGLNRLLPDPFTAKSDVRRNMHMQEAYFLIYAYA